MLRPAYTIDGVSSTPSTTPDRTARSLSSRLMTTATSETAACCLYRCQRWPEPSSDPVSCSLERMSTRKTPEPDEACARVMQISAAFESRKDRHRKAPRRRTRYACRLEAEMGAAWPADKGTIIFLLLSAGSDVWGPSSCLPCRLCCCCWACSSRLAPVTQSAGYALHLSPPLPKQARRRSSHG